MYSDDEYESFTDRRTKPQSGGAGSEWRHDPRAGEKFWEDVNAKENRTKEDFARKVWDEFDDFFDFSKDSNKEEKASGIRDETKGADYKAEIEIEFMDAFKGVKTVRYLVH